jgi:hypothetical protein
MKSISPPKPPGLAVGGIPHLANTQSDGSQEDRGAGANRHLPVASGVSGLAGHRGGAADQVPLEKLQLVPQ